MGEEFVEVLLDGRRDLVALRGERATLGKDAGNDIVVDHSTVSRLHAVLERLGPAWVVRDLTSRNGTFVNGDRISTERPLRDQDEIRLGDARVVFRAPRDATGPFTELVAAPLPELTKRERDVLIALCRPVIAGDVFTEPASIRQVAAELSVSDAAVKQHLTHLYDKFGLHDDVSGRRRVRLANEAVRRGAVRPADLASD